MVGGSHQAREAREKDVDELPSAQATDLKNKGSVVLEALSLLPKILGPLAAPIHHKHLGQLVCSQNGKPFVDLHFWDETKNLKVHYDILVGEV